MKSGGLRAAAPAVLAALAIMASACASSTGARPRPFPQPGKGTSAVRPPDPDAPVAEPDIVAPPDVLVAVPPAIAPPVAALLAYALEFRGVPYVYGGSDPSGFDCSGFTQWVFAKNGVKLPREVKDQFRTGLEVAADAVAPGDLLFFATTSGAASHVAIALDAGTFVHAPNSRGVVRVERMSSYWADRYLGTRRYFIAPANE